MSKITNLLNYNKFYNVYKKELRLGLILGVFYTIYSFIGNAFKLDPSYKSLLSNLLLLIVILTFLISGFKAYKVRQRESIISSTIVGLAAWAISIISLFIFSIIFTRSFNWQSIFAAILYSLIVTLILGSLLGGFGGFLAIRFKKKKK